MANRQLALLLISALTATTNATFELMLVANNISKSIHRIDTGTGITLGTFGDGLLTGAYGVGIDQPNNTAYVLEGSYVSRFNYNTGEFLATGFATGFMANGMSRLRDGTLLIWSNTLARRFAFNGTQLATYTVPSGQVVKEGTLGPDGRIYLTTQLSAGVNELIHWYSIGGGTQQGQSSWFNAVMTANSTHLLTAYSNTVYERWAPTASGGPSSSYASTFSSPHVAYNAAAIGHGGMAYFGVLPSSGSSVVTVARYDSTANLFRGTFGTFTSVDGMDVVVAPEPGTMIALSLGGFVLLRRRRKAC